MNILLQVYYVPLPGKQERVNLLKSELGKMKHCISSSSMKSLGETIDGFTIEDIKTLINKANNYPLAKAMSSKSFRCERNELTCMSKYLCSLWHICKNDDDSAVSMDYNEAKKLGGVCIPSLTWHDILTALSKTLPSVSKDSLSKYVIFGKKHGIVIDEPYLNRSDDLE